MTLSSELTSAVTEALQGMGELLVFGGAQARLTEARRLDRALGREQRRVARVAALQSGLVPLVAHLAAVASLVVAIPQVGSGALTGVELAVLALAVVASFEAVLPLPLAAQHLFAHAAAAKRLIDLTDTTLPIREPALPVRHPPTALLSVRGLRFRYAVASACTGALATRDTASAESRWNLDGIDLELAPGERVAIVGPTGSGKSTLARLLLRFWEPDSGSILLAGRSIDECAAEDVRRCFAAVSRESWLAAGSVRENLLIGRAEATQDEMWQALQVACARDFVRALPQGLDTMVGEQGARLSAGQRQRLALARAVLSRAPVLLLDEATAHLDPVTARAVEENILQLCGERALIWITHRRSCLSEMDEIIVLEQGRVVERGREDELLARGQRYAALMQPPAATDMAVASPARLAGSRRVAS